MSRDDTMVTEGDLLAYVDGSLEAGRRAAVEAHIANSKADAETVTAWRRQNETIAALYRPTADEPVPPRLDIRQIAEAGGRPGFRFGPLGIAASIVLCLALGSAGGWYGRALMTPVAIAQNSLVGEAVAAHALYAGEVVHPVEVRGSDEGHLSAWLSKRLDRAIATPDLNALGFHLVGGRLLPAGDKPAAQFMYEDESGRRITLYVVPTPEGRETSFQYAQLDRLEAFFWRDETISCALVGDLPRKQLHALAMQAYRQLG